MAVDLQQFAENLRQEVIAESLLEGAENLRAETFTRRVIQELTDAGELNDGEVAYYKAKGIEISGYSISEDDTELYLIGTIHTQAVPPLTVTKDRVETSVARLQAFFERSRQGLANSIEESTPAFDMAVSIRDLKGLETLRLFVVTDGLTTTRTWPSQETDGVKRTVHVWDIRRLYQCFTSGQQQESIDIDFIQRFGKPLPCLAAPHKGIDYRAHLAIVPGPVLAAIYEEFGTRLLERNVRAFLQSRGKVNQGIRNTILSEPERFFAYNNGISATASSIRVVPLSEGGFGIARVTDLQIVNGGQTTASIHHVAKRDKADISQIFVPAKLTIVPAEKLNEMVPLISRYANSQNKVNEADFAANDPFHVRIENWSRTVWAPATGGSQQQTRWFYERARGQYQDAVSKEMTPARMRLFKTVHPVSQKFTKTDLAKFENTWDQLPHVVSLGAEKSFRQFTLRLSQRGKFEVTKEYFERLAAKAILFRRSERIVSEQQFGGYRANIVTYSIAYLTNVTSQQIDLDAIWRAQDISPVLAEAVETVCYPIRDILLAAPGSGNITEWCKKVACWQRVRELEIRLSRALRRELNDAVHDPWRMTELISAALAESVQSLSKSQILDKAGLPEDAWSSSIRTLLAQGKVVQHGTKRGATYSLASDE